MITASDSITVDASPEAVFEYLDDPYNHLTITPSLVQIDNIESLDNGGKRLDHTFKLGGIDLNGALTQTVYEPPTRHTFEMTGRLEGEIDIELTEDDGQTVVTYTAGYDLPGDVIERLADPFVRRYNERELGTTLENLKNHIEAN